MAGSVKILGIAGSVRKASFNKSALRAARKRDSVWSRGNACHGVRARGTGVLTVHNQGPAISESARQRIFEPLVRGERRNQPRKSNSLGLGLYIAREIAIAHGGSIDVKSSEDKGTTFTVYLPRR